MSFWWKYQEYALIFETSLIFNEVVIPALTNGTECIPNPDKEVIICLSCNDGTQQNQDLYMNNHRLPLKAKILTNLPSYSS
jgi:hypothetical protein